MSDFLMELGCEELPPKFIESVSSQWEFLIPFSLKEEHIKHESLRVYTTPRRLAVILTGLPTHQDNYTEEVKGPPVSIAFQQGELTKVGSVFLSKNGLTQGDIEVRTTPKGDFLYGLKHYQGKSVEEVLVKLVPQWIEGLEGERFMRWGECSMKFPRPITWLVTLLNGELLPMCVNQVVSGNMSKGHRVLYPGSVNIPHPSMYVSALREVGVVVSTEERAELIREGVKACGEEVQGCVSIPESLLQEVVNLVEWPTCITGKFSEEFLELPKDVITTIMVKHQRYFPVYNHTKDTLLPYFITVSNGDPYKVDCIRQGNERVLKARLSDGKFFYEQDTKKPLEDFLPLLDGVTYQEGLGTLMDKTQRVQVMSNYICDQLGIGELERGWIQRAALLCKADLVTQVVYEFPELQGVIGGIYARLSGEPVEVSKGIQEHYRDGSMTNLIESLVGQVVSISDRLDTITSLFNIGKVPSGSSDLYALKRAGNNVLHTIWSSNLSIDLYELLELSFDSSKTDTLVNFFLQRIEALLVESNRPLSIIGSVIGTSPIEVLKRVSTVPERCRVLSRLEDSKELSKVHEAFIRATHLGNKGNLGTSVIDSKGLITKGLLNMPEEQDLYHYLVSTFPSVLTMTPSELMEGVLVGLAPKVNAFLDSVFVMDEDVYVRANRLNLLGLVRNYSFLLGDFTKINKA